MISLFEVSSISILTLFGWALCSVRDETSRLCEFPGLVYSENVPGMEFLNIESRPSAILSDHSFIVDP